MMVKKNGVASETFGSLAMESPLGQKQSHVSGGGGWWWKDPYVSGTGLELDSQCRVKSPLPIPGHESFADPEPSARGKDLAEIPKAVWSFPGPPEGR